MSDHNAENRDLAPHLSELDRLLGELGGHLALRQERRTRRRARLAWGAAAAIALAGASAIVLVVRSPSGDPTSESTSGNRSIVDTLGGPGDLSACAVRDQIPSLIDSDGVTSESVMSTAIEAPQLLNRGELLQALEQEYPPELRSAEERGTSLIYFLVGDTGVVEEIMLAESSGHEAFDEAALRLARRFQFSPALGTDGRTTAWVRVPITFAPERTSCPLCRRIPPPELLARAC